MICRCEIQRCKLVCQLSSFIVTHCAKISGKKGLALGHNHWWLSRHIILSHFLCHKSKLCHKSRLKKDFSFPANNNNKSTNLLASIPFVICSGMSVFSYVNLNYSWLMIIHLISQYENMCQKLLLLCIAQMCIRREEGGLKVINSALPSML